MRKNVFGRKLKRDVDERKALFKGLISNLILKERVKTTTAKAKAIRSLADKIITIAKKGENARNFLQGLVYKETLDKLLNDIAPRFEKRQGGYTRIIRLGKRLSDKASMVVMELTEYPIASTRTIKKEKTATTEDTEETEKRTQKLSNSAVVRKPAITEIQKKIEAPSKIDKARKKLSVSK